TMPVKAAGCLTEPPVSVPKDTVQRLAWTATADPPEDPPGTLDSSMALSTLPWTEFSLEEPIPNSSQFNRPMMIASSSINFWIAVAVNWDSKPSRILLEEFT